jgi:hypothetical protein
MNNTRNTTMDNVKIAGTQESDHWIRNFAPKAGQSIWHLVQMALVMEAGMMVYHRLLLPVLAPTGFSTLTKEYPLFGYWMMVASMTLPMIALMRGYHRSTWRYCLEMSTAMLAPLAALTLLVVCQLMPIHILYGVGDPVMILAMAAFMLFRPGHHAHGGHEHAGHQHASPIEAETTRQTTDQLHEAGEENQAEHACHTALD